MSGSAPRPLHQPKAQHGERDQGVSLRRQGLKIRLPYLLLAVLGLTVLVVILYYLLT